MHREHYALSTERTYCDWIRKFVKFHQMQTREALFVEQEKSWGFPQLFGNRKECCGFNTKSSL